MLVPIRQPAAPFPLHQISLVCSTLSKSSPAFQRLAQSNFPPPLLSVHTERSILAPAQPQFSPTCPKCPSHSATSQFTNHFTSPACAGVACRRPLRQHTHLLLRSTTPRTRINQPALSCLACGGSSPIISLIGATALPDGRSLPLSGVWPCELVWFYFFPRVALSSPTTS